MPTTSLPHLDADSAKRAEFFAARQGLLRRSEQSNRDCLETVGWSRSVGGANTYLSLFARNGSSPRRAEQDVATHEIFEIASARGCTYTLPNDHFRLGIKCGQGFNDAAAIRTAKSKLGVTDEDIQKLADGIIRVLEAGTLEIAELKKGLGDLVVNYGEAGKKIGQTTNLSLGLLKLQAEGKIRRVPMGGRLDSQTYAYELYPDPLVVDDSYSKDQAYAELAELYWRWTGIASMAHFQWFSGLSGKLAKVAVGDLALVERDGLLAESSTWEEFDTFQRATEPCYRLISPLDGLLLLKRDLSDVLPVNDAGTTHGLFEIAYHAIIDRGRIIGFWEFDSAKGIIAYTEGMDMTEELRTEIARTETMIRDELGDCRMTSMDSPKSRQPKIDAITSGEIRASRLPAS